MSEMTDTMHLRLKELREYLKLKQGAISTQLGLKQSYYSDVENGKRPVTTRIIIGLRDKYNVSSEWLYTGWGEMFLTNVDIPRTLNFVPDVYPIEKKVNNKVMASQFDLLYRFNDLIKENYPEYDSYKKDINSIMKTGELIEELRYSKIGYVLYFYLDLFMKKKELKGFKEFKDIGLQAVIDGLPYKSLVADFATACNNFANGLIKVKAELDFDFDFDEYFEIQTVEVEEDLTLKKK